MSQPRRPIDGSIARGYAGNATKGRGISHRPNGSVPYYYADTEEERTRATAEIIKNPYPITTAGLEEGKNLYNINCGICHGEKGDGAGYLVRDDGGKYPVQPANFLLDDLINSSNGRYYHSIMYGKNLMGGYSDKLSYKERWNVIHYIRSLQASHKKLEYSEKANTLTKVEIPGSTVPQIIVDKKSKDVDTIVVLDTNHKAEKH
jgi:mono/diheme cytochrome c family protein